VDGDESDGRGVVLGGVSVGRIMSNYDGLRRHGGRLGLRGWKLSAFLRWLRSLRLIIVFVLRERKRVRGVDPWLSRGIGI
jgi:hypothetical protein